jgi:hypothetical protein
VKAYVLGVLGALTQLLNAILGGDRDQSFSSRSWEALQAGKSWPSVIVPLLDRIFFWERQHCYRAFQSDIERSYDRATRNP